MRLIWIAIAAVTLLARPALAEDRTKAAQLFTAGEQAFADSDFLTAAQYYEAAYVQYAAPEIAFSAAQAYRLQFAKEQKPEYIKRAIELYEAYLAKVKKGGRVGDAAAYLDDLRDRWRDLVKAGLATDASMTYDKTQLTILVDGRIKDPVVQIDDKDVAANKYVDVAAGTHTVHVEAPGYEAFVQKVEVANQTQLSVQAALAAKPATITIKTEHGVRVAIDGRVTAVRGGVVEAPAGKRYITVTRRGRKPFSRELDLAPGSAMTLEATLRPTEQRRITRFIWIGSAVLVGLTAATLTTAIVYDRKAAGIRDDHIDTDADARAYDDARGKRNSFRSATIVLGGVSLFAIAAATTLYLFDNPQAESAPPLTPKSDDVKFMPLAVSDGAGLAIGGGW